MATAAVAAVGSSQYVIRVRSTVEKRSWLDFAASFSIPRRRAIGFGKSVKNDVVGERKGFKIHCELQRPVVSSRNNGALEECAYEVERSKLSVVMKFGGSSLASAARMREVAELILGFSEERPVIVLSAMGKTTNKLLLVLFFFNLCFN